ncbi:MAG: hypothetical protein ABR971_00330 [Acidobacteriaceae bacterium]|jgi:hypothetical protein
MNRTTTLSMSTVLTSLLVFGAFASFVENANAQSPELQQRVAEVKAASAQNKQALMSFNWTEQVTISLKGDVKKVEHNQVRLGPDGTPQKTSLDPPPAPPSGGRLKQRVVANKTDEYTDYANSMKALAQQYVPPDGALLEQAYAQGNITLGAVPGNPNAVQLVVHNYLKPEDSMTLVFDKVQKALLGIQIASYLSGPSDAMTLSVQFSQIPGGPNHVSSMDMNGVSKQLNIAIQNSNYQHN